MVEQQPHFVGPEWEEEKNEVPRNLSRSYHSSDSKDEECAASYEQSKNSEKDASENEDVGGAGPSGRKRKGTKKKKPPKKILSAIWEEQEPPESCMNLPRFFCGRRGAANAENEAKPSV